MAKIPAQYRDWKISTKAINGQVWLRFTHPQEHFPRYGCPISAAGIAATISHIRFLIDLATELEKGAPQKRLEN
ncbi:MAG: hypothetical protein KME06_20445 [Kastovskya adunca ATA6-11-RM4]|jgi:hypothetical protein|nr:hypothetical protein [Kastovskya adunca ATA6-11-RM4]